MMPTLISANPKPAVYAMAGYAVTIIIADEELRRGGVQVPAASTLAHGHFARYSVTSAWNIVRSVVVTAEASVR